MNSVVAMDTSSPSYRYEPRPSDREQIRRIVESTGFFFPYEVDVAVELLDTRLEKGESDSGYSFVFAEEQGRVIGYACYGAIACTQSSFDLYWIAVENSGQRKGVGKQILRRAEQRIWEAGGRRVYIETSNRDLYRPTRGFYEATGYIKEAVLVDFYAPGDDKVIYVRTLEITRG